MSGSSSHSSARALGREEGKDPKTVNRKLIVALMALRNAGAEIEMRIGDLLDLRNGSRQAHLHTPVQAAVLPGSL